MDNLSLPLQAAFLRQFPANCSPLAQGSVQVGALSCMGVCPFAPHHQGTARRGGRAEECAAIPFGVWAAAAGVAPRACTGAVLSFLALQIHRKGVPMDHVFPHPLVPGEGRRNTRRASASCLPAPSSQPHRGKASGVTALTGLSPQNQKFNYTWLRLIQHGELCIAHADAAGALGLRRCEGRSRSLTWLHRSLVAFQPELVSEALARAAPAVACDPWFGLACRHANWWAAAAPCKARGVPWPSGLSFAKAVFPPEVKCWSPSAFPPGGGDARPAIGSHRSK